VKTAPRIRLRGVYIRNFGKFSVKMSVLGFLSLHRWGWNLEWRSGPMDLNFTSYRCNGKGIGPTKVKCLLKIYHAGPGVKAFIPGPAWCGKHDASCSRNHDIIHFYVECRNNAASACRIRCEWWFRLYRLYFPDDVTLVDHISFYVTKRISLNDWTTFDWIILYTVISAKNRLELNKSVGYVYNKFISPMQAAKHKHTITKK